MAAVQRALFSPRRIVHAALCFAAVVITAPLGRT
jgi:hypothetical protein